MMMYMKTVNIECLGYSLVADWYDGQTTDEIILYLMGYSSSRTRQADAAKIIVQKTGRSMLVIDYSGHGDSPFDIKDIRPAQHVVEVITAYDWIRSRYPNAKISIVSASYGSFLTGHLIMYRAVEQLVLRVPAIYPPAALYDLWSVRFADEEKYRTEITAYRTDIPLMKQHPILKNAQNFKGKTLVVIHSEDQTIPAETTDAYSDAFVADRYVVEGFKHAISESNPTNAQKEAYHVAVADWLNKTGVTQ
jgi:fermentation-respiration switch protein FrsA (DUF1100 family)